jgi:deoxycytidylate deaminase
VVVLNGKPVGVGYNDFNTISSLQKPYEFLNKNKKPNKTKVIGLHAEIAAILDAKRRKCVDISGAKIYVARVLKTTDMFGHQSLGMARPCAMCQQLLVNARIKKAIYTITDEECGILRL